MGSYNDFRSPSRESWKYEYSGSYLLEYARKKLARYTNAETVARDMLAKRLNDRNTKANSDRNQRLRTQIETYANEREKCLVWVHEFTRNPDNKYLLTLGDVTYFDIAGIPSNESDESGADNAEDYEVGFGAAGS